MTIEYDANKRRLVCFYAEPRPSVFQGRDIVIERVRRLFLRTNRAGILPKDLEKLKHPARQAQAKQYFKELPPNTSSP